jgi:hypothetical protein
MLWNYPRPLPMHFCIAITKRIVYAYLHRNQCERGFDHE